MPWVGFTSIHANPNTAKSLALLEDSGLSTIVVTQMENRERLERVAGRAVLDRAIVVSSFSEPTEAAHEMVSAVVDRQISLDNWVNITDDTTAMFLASCELLGLRFDFLTAYRNCRIKSITRKLLAEGMDGGCLFSVHDIEDTNLPAIDMPFIAKPILGSGSRGVAIIRDENEWRYYLARASDLLRTYAVSLGDVHPGREILVEQLLDGQEYQIDGIVRNGAIDVCAIGVKSAGYCRFGFREERGMLYRPGHFADCASDDAEFALWCERVLGIVGFQNGVFHIEAMRRQSESQLLEVNPRPGGGGNVPAIKRLSGVDLNQECLSLWVGAARPARSDPVNGSLCFAVRYPAVVGRAGYVRKEGTISMGDRPLSQLEWIPLVGTGDKLDPSEKEQYLGVLLAPDQCGSRSEWTSVTSLLLDKVSGPDFVEELESAIRSS